MSLEIVATLVAGRENRLDRQAIGEIAGKTKALSHAWLSEEAVDVFYKGYTPEEISGLIQENSASLVCCDLFIQPVSSRRKQLLLADMESTIIEQEMLDELAGVIGLRDKVSDITRRAMNGELDFKAALGERVKLLKGQSEEILAQVARKITLMPGATTLVATMRKHGAQCWLVSGGFTYFSEPIAVRLGFNRAYANKLLMDGDLITGEVADPVLDKNAKKDFLEKACAEYSLALSQAMAVGDGANDVPMLNACNAGHGMGIAYHAKPNVRAVVPHQVNYGDLTALLYAQGYSKSQFAS